MLLRRWNPWRALRDRAHIELVWADMDGCPGRAEREGDRQRVLLDPTLGRIERNAVLAHELVHLERGILYCPSTPPALVAKEEAAVEAIVADRLVPPALLQQFILAMAEVDGVTVADVASEFEVPLDVAERALQRFTAMPEPDVERRAG